MAHMPVENAIRPLMILSLFHWVHPLCTADRKV
jgi:hypothetical protein